MEARPTRRPFSSRVERLEGRDLLSAMVFHSPSGTAPVRVAAASAPVAPTVASVQFEPLTGRVLVVFAGDSSGYDPAALTNPANYGLSLVQSTGKLPSQDPSRAKAGVVLAPEFVVTGVSLTTPSTPGTPQTVVVTIDNNQPLRPGSYRFSIRSAGIVDGAGQPLNGSYSGAFPSGDTKGGGDFAAILAQAKNTVLPALPTSAGPTPGPGVAPKYVFLPSTQGVQVRYAAAKPGRFQLAGGNKITLIPLGKQHFPGTFRLAKLDPTLLPGAPKAAKRK